MPNNKAFRRFRLAVSLYSAGVFVGMVALAVQGQIVATGIATLFASIVPMGVIGRLIERRKLSQIFNVRIGFWSFILGDSISLPICMMACAAGLRSVGSGDHYYSSWWWSMLACLLGILAGFIFRLYDHPGYAKQQSTDLLDSPTKYYHDYGAYPSLAGALFGAGVPLVGAFLTQAGAGLGVPTLVAVMALGTWVALCVGDSFRNVPLANVHIRFDWEQFAPTRS